MVEMDESMKVDEMVEVDGDGGGGWRWWRWMR